LVARAQRSHDLVVIGASTGGVEALRELVSGLPADLPATVCVVLHIAPTGASALAEILDRAGPLPAHAARDGERLTAGHVVVAPPDRHLELQDRHVRLSVGPRENGHRPSVDTLFRSAAHARGGRVVGVILSGNLDDGAAGLAMIKARGGAAVVQDPDDAAYAGMPRSALAAVTPDVVAPVSEIAGAIDALCRGDMSIAPEEDEGEGGESGAGEPPEDPFITTCPDCGGVLSERREADVVQFSCRVGHRFSVDSLVEAQGGTIEAALWAAVRALEDRRMLCERLAERFEVLGQTRSAGSFRRRAADAEEQAQLVRATLAQATRTSVRSLDSREAGNLGGIA
jgi:two-component system chemotaxis response regulator CheB